MDPAGEKANSVSSGAWATRTFAAASGEERIRLVNEIIDKGANKEDGLS